ncbi:hypothetical protein J8273_7376 [Carpediemonas membranifera]|uniref:Uncharacterized protein n=1 Tax=Carpediemonas membranifera TaxID=201153 RepID=A0A8J6E1V0_9EUKA|nr:hypothetical protein J8273_7376 [Carpediemonas membranifera]|eukprot:KAG9391102.1 hypothetical protein J8273_7376 [Carpediemonas membranifera]
MLGGWGDWGMFVVTASMGAISSTCRSCSLFSPLSWIFTLVQLSIQLLTRVWPFLEYCWDIYANRSYGKYWTMVDRMPMLAKRPSHVCFIVEGFTDAQLNKLSTLIVCCIELRARRISLYLDGVDAKKLGELNVKLQERISINLVHATTSNVVFMQPGLIRDEDALAIDVRTDLSRRACDADVVIDVIGPDTAQEVIGHAMRSCKPGNPLTEYLPESLATCADCALICAATASLCGCPPTLVSDAELVECGPLGWMTPGGLFRAMKAYAGREQRKGK